MDARDGEDDGVDPLRLRLRSVELFPGDQQEQVDGEVDMDVDGEDGANGGGGWVELHFEYRCSRK